MNQREFATNKIGQIKIIIIIIIHRKTQNKN